MKYIVWGILVLALLLLFGGIFSNAITGEEHRITKILYGSGTLILFFVWIPVFLSWRSNKSKFFDRINKMRGKEDSLFNNKEEP